MVKLLFRVSFMVWVRVRVRDNIVRTPLFAIAPLNPMKLHVSPGRLRLPDRARVRHVQAAARETDRVRLVVGEGGGDLGSGGVHRRHWDAGRHARLLRCRRSTRHRLLRRSAAAVAIHRLLHDVEARRTSTARTEGPVVARAHLYRQGHP